MLDGLVGAPTCALPRHAAIKLEPWRLRETQLFCVAKGLIHPLFRLRASPCIRILGESNPNLVTRFHGRGEGGALTGGADVGGGADSPRDGVGESPGGTIADGGHGIGDT
jgi:hypothetical protein